MLTRLLTLLLLILAFATTTWAKGKLDPAALMAKSDALYYYPAQHGVKDLAVDLVIDRLAADPGMKQIQISYYYAGDDFQRFVVAGASNEKLRAELLTLVSPLAEALMPRPSAASFEGMALSAKKVSRQLAGIKGTTFYQLIGTPKEKEAPIKEYRVLLSPEGLVHEIENVLPQGPPIAARIENTKIGEAWHISRITTRLMAKTGPQWKIDEVQYAPVQGFVLPERIATKYRDSFNLPVKGAADFEITLQNYRINAGAAAAVFASDTPEAPAGQ